MKQSDIQDIKISLYQERKHTQGERLNLINQTILELDEINPNLTPEQIKLIDEIW